MKRSTAAPRAPTPGVTTDQAGVSITWSEERDDRRLRRIGEILSDILDTATTPGEREES